MSCRLLLSASEYSRLAIRRNHMIGMLSCYEVPLFDADTILALMVFIPLLTSLIIKHPNFKSLPPVYHNLHLQR